MADPTVPPELASILATLAQFAPQQQAQQYQNPATAPPSLPTTPANADPRLQGRKQPQSDHPAFPSNLDQFQSSANQDEYDPSGSYNPEAAEFHPVKPQSRTTSHQPQQQEQNIIDPATITEWSAGLRCVTKVAAQTPMFADKIRGVCLGRVCSCI